MDSSMRATPTPSGMMDDIPGVSSREETYSPIPGSLPSDITWDPEDIASYTNRLCKDNDYEGKLNLIYLIPHKISEFGEMLAG